MPDLSHLASAQFWFEYPDPMIYRVITFMESIETWTLDGETLLEKAIHQLGKELDTINKLDMDRIEYQDTFIRLICNLKSGRVLRLLQSIDAAHPGAASKLLMHAEEITEGAEDPAGIFLRRNIVFERLRLLGRIFLRNDLT